MKTFAFLILKKLLEKCIIYVVKNNDITWDDELLKLFLETREEIRTIES